MNDAKLQPELLTIQQWVYEASKIQYSQVTPEPEGKEYGAYTFELEGLHIKFRVAKITPKKVGQFVTFWKRNEGGPIQPFAIEDPFHFLVVYVRSPNQEGQFVFPKEILQQHGIVAKAGKGGKRAFRVYPPWDLTINRQAQKTQEWQLAYFLGASTEGNNLSGSKMIEDILTKLMIG